MAEHVIDVPKISCSSCPSRSLVPEPQVAEQLGGGADRLVSFAWTMEPARRHSSSSSWWATAWSSRSSSQGQSSTATHSSGKRISERIVEQIVDFPAQTVEQIVDICTAYVPEVLRERGGALRFRS